MPGEPRELAQSEALALLSDPATYGSGVHRVERIDTHAATVFLAGERAYKVKRAVRFSFLDYSSLAARRQACAEELRLNRRTAPDLYLRSFPITRQGDVTGVVGASGVSDMAGMIPAGVRSNLRVAPARSSGRRWGDGAAARSSAGRA